MTYRPYKNPSAQFRFLMFGIVFSVALYALWTQVERQTASANGVAGEQVVIVTRTGQQHIFNVEIADTYLEQEQGLMYRQELALDGGMLFLFGEERPAKFWMRNTYIPLDMIFVAKGGEIIHIHPDARPQDTTAISSPEPVIAVLEINGGTAARLGIQVGDRLTYDPPNQAAE